ncbi:predicted protein [Lichtheimia corymbifera JMRC:FSU:9682]|uniref:Cysteine-rich transmembrane domain-containing protein n=1 Tax=Lichtheimia corymbifera JMRC:FSU:9682 TaxID=1263082 RepID=A0A068SGX9_9FUNG|nr:predicted protein [Lichtheimia corymbifera JMRC:FSU:9682]
MNNNKGQYSYPPPPNPTYQQQPYYQPPPTSQQYSPYQQQPYQQQPYQHQQQYYQPQPPPQSVYVQQRPNDSGAGEGLCLGCLTACCLCCTLDALF